MVKRGAFLVPNQVNYQVVGRMGKELGLPDHHLAKNADVMVCCCWDDQERMEQRREVSGICGTTDAARLAQEAGVKKLVLVHIGPELGRHGDMEKGIGDIKRIYDGEVIFGEELMSFEMGR